MFPNDPADRRPLEPARCAELIRNSKAAVALTGAGISTAAGIPDFRGPAGVYALGRYDPEKVFEIGWFRREPGHFYEFTRDLLARLGDVRPTFTHRLLAELEKAGHLAGVVTQNIDILHELAGSRNVLELHGSYRSAECLACQRIYAGLDYAWWRQAVTGGPRPPLALCPDCGGVLKPDIVFFGELVHGFPEAERLVAGCDLLLVIGSTLEVAPASLLPGATEARKLVVNRGGVRLPEDSRHHFVGSDIDDYFRQVAHHLDLAPSKGRGV